ncbi:hypothetical protein ACFL1G_10700 [Planctomycetota bacterium]
MWSQRDGRLSTITKVKVLSPEMFLVLGEGFSMSETSIATCVSCEYVSNMPGSKAMVGNRIVCTGTWESHIVPIVEASNELKRRRRKYGDMAVGLTHIRGVDGVTPIESPSSLEGVTTFLFHCPTTVLFSESRIV